MRVDSIRESVIRRRVPLLDELYDHWDLPRNIHFASANLDTLSTRSDGSWCAVFQAEKATLVSLMYDERETVGSQCAERCPEAAWLLRSILRGQCVYLYRVEAGLLSTWLDEQARSAEADLTWELRKAGFQD